MSCNRLSYILVAQHTVLHHFHSVQCECVWVGGVGILDISEISIMMMMMMIICTTALCYPQLNAFPG